MTDSRRPPAAGLRATVRRGAVYYSGRMIANLAITAVGIVVLTRIVGPANYGVYAGLLGLAVFLQVLTRFGVDAYLIRRAPEEISLVHERVALGFLLISGLSGWALGSMFSWLVLPTGYARFQWAVVLMLFGAMANVVATCPLARLERSLRFKRVAWIELSGQVVLYACALALALAGFGFPALALGFFAQQTFLATATFVAAGWRALPSMSFKELKRLLAYGAPYSLGVWIWQARQLALVTVVTPIAGPAIAGQLALAIRLVEVANVLRSAVWRLAMPALARVRHSSSRLSAAVDGGTFLSLIAVGLPCAGLSALATPVVRIAFGEEWGAAASVIPLLAVGSIANILNYLTTSALHTLERNWPMVLMNAIVISILLGVTAVLLPFAGPIAYGLAEVVSIVGYLVLIPVRRRAHLSPLHWGTVALAGGLAASCTLTLLSPAAGLACLALVLANPLVFRRVRSLLSDGRSSVKVEGQLTQ
ncbi:oligosaccharide flippase family protein [Geodermatophilus sp. URMC 65]